MESQSIPSAYVVEDDAVFHDDFNALFPLVSLIILTLWLSELICNLNEVTDG